MQFGYLLASCVRNFENVHFQYLSGAIDEVSWAPWPRRLSGMLETPGGRAGWDEQADAFNDEFQAMVGRGSEASVAPPAFAETPREGG